MTETKQRRSDLLVIGGTISNALVVTFFVVRELYVDGVGDAAILGLLALCFVALTLWRASWAIESAYFRGETAGMLAERTRHEGDDRRAASEELEEVLASERWSPQARDAIRACISQVRHGDYRHHIDEARMALGLGKRGTK